MKRLYSSYKNVIVSAISLAANGKIKKIGRRGLLVPMIVVILTIMIILGYMIYNYSKFERGVVVRFRYVSVADKMAQAAAMEAANWFRYKTINYRNLDKSDRLDRFVLAGLMEKKINGMVLSLYNSELKSYSIIKKLGGKLESVELKYEGLRKYFNDPQEASDYSKSAVLSVDPFERFGSIAVTSTVTYMNIKRAYYCRFDIKTSNTLLPLLSKFTFFTKDRDGAGENQLKMATVSGETDIGGQGIIDSAASCAPMVFVHHPDDIRNIKQYGKSHAELREYLPMDKSINSPSADSYRPSMTERGWVYLGSETPDDFYLLNITPGKANPDMIMPYPSDMRHLFYGSGFSILESDLCWLVFNSLKGVFPYPHSFTDSKKPSDMNDYIIRTTHSGIYWITKDPDTKPILGNYTESNKNFTSDSSLIQLSGDIQPLSFGESSKPSKYLDRRSPTLVFGKVFRSFVQLGTITQNCVHSSASCDSNHYASNMMPNGMHRLPYVNPPNHPKTTFMPFFNITEDGAMESNPVFDVDNPSWGNYRMVDDSDIYGGGDFSKQPYDIDKDVFNLCDSNHYKTYRQFMCKIVNEVYNKSYNWITANSKPAGGVLEPGDSYMLKQNEIKIVESYPDKQVDSLFFYNHKKEFGNVFAASKLKIMQYLIKGDSYSIASEVFESGIFKGALGALKLSSDKYKNPFKIKEINDPGEYDVRQKVNYIFESYADFEKSLMLVEGDCRTLKEGGVYYIDSAVDFTCDGSAKKLIFHDNALIICSGNVKVPSISKSKYANGNKASLSIVSVNGDVVISGEEIEASLNSFEGTIKKEVDYFQIYGNATMKTLYFNLSSPNNLFKVKSYPKETKSVLGKLLSDTMIRMSVTYDPALDVCKYENYFNHYKYYMSTKPSFWRYSIE